MSTHALNELDKDGTGVCWTLDFNKKKKKTNNINLTNKKNPDVQFSNYCSLHFSPLCALQ